MPRETFNIPGHLDLDFENRAFCTFVREKRRSGALSQNEYVAIHDELGKVATAAGTDFDSSDPVVESVVRHGLSNMIKKLQELRPALYAEYVAQRRGGWQR